MTLKLSNNGDFSLDFKALALFYCKTCTLFVLAIMRMPSRSLVSPSTTIGLTSAVVVVIAIILMPSNITIINAQQDQSPTIGQLPVQVTQKGTTTVFQSTTDGIRLNVPEDWVIHDVNNTGSTFSEESRQGYGILAQLCPQELQQQEQQRAAVSNNVSRGEGGGGDTVRCQGSEGDIIHIVRYPDLDARLQAANNITTTNNNNMTIDNILLYHMQKLGQVGYRNIEIVNNTDTTLNVMDPQTNQTITTVPAKFVEMTYSTVSAPNEIREGYFISTATNATAPYAGITKGYSIFYEGNSTTTAAGTATAATIQQTTTATPSIRLGAPILPPLPAAIQQIFDSFELIAAPDVAQDMLAAQSEQAQEQEVAEEEEPTSSSLAVDITSSDTEGEEATVPATFEFEADVSGGTEHYTYRWNFDDHGRSSDEQTVSHTFEEAGTYNVRLTVTDSSGQRASDSIRITVEEEEEPSPSPTIIEPSTQEEEDDISESNLPPQQEQPDSSAPPTAPTEKIPAEQPTAQGNNQGGEQGEATTRPPTVTQSIQQNASQNTQVGIPNDNQGGEATTEPHTSSLDFNDNGASSSEERSDEDDDDENIDHISDEAGSHNGDRTVTDSEDQRVSNSVESRVETPPEEPQEEEPSTEEVPAGQPTAGEVKPDLLDTDNNSGSDDLIDVDDVFDVDGFINNLFDKLGLDN